MVPYAYNRRERDFTDHWRMKGEKQNWDTHRDQFLRALANAKKCVMIISSQVASGQCVPRPPLLDDFRKWERVIQELDDPGPFENPVLIPSPQTTINGWDLFWAGALAAGGTALLAGQAGPQVALPEEIVTVPVAGVIGGFVAFFGASL